MNDINVVNVLKGLVIDSIAKSKSGHPGGAMSSMDFAYILFTEYLKFDPNDPEWMGRDRFILSAGHESMLLYSLLAMIGWLEIDDLQQFRQFGSRTPGHPEFEVTPGVECTTGPLGQGAAMSVGFAIGAKHLGEVLNKELFSYKTYSLLGDGCMQEDIVLGAASLAGHLKLSNLVWYYDKNSVQIGGPISRNTSMNEVAVFKAMGWDVLEIDGHDYAAIRTALDSTKNALAPTLIIGRTTMAKGAFSLEGSAKTHGSPLPADELIKTKEKLGLPTDKSFYLPDEAITYFQRNFAERLKEVKEWSNKLNQLRGADTGFENEFKKYFYPVDVSSLSPIEWDKTSGMATRSAFGKVLSSYATQIPKLIGGSADLEESNGIGEFCKDVKDFSSDNPSGRNIVFGVREFAMAAICNGLALNGGAIPFASTFLVFSDYARSAIRLAAIQSLKVMYAFTHDSFYVGEDGPTHQPIEHVMSLRLIPNLYVFRPADPQETEVLFKEALTLNSPSVFCLTRQKLPYLGLSQKMLEGAENGAYCVREDKNPEYIIFASGSEVHVALEVANNLNSQVCVVSIPCWELFEDQDPSYKDKILKPEIKKRISIEAGSTLGWQKYTGNNGLNVGVDHFGVSAPSEVLEQKLQFNAKDIVKKIKQYNFT